MRGRVNPLFSSSLLTMPGVETRPDPLNMYEPRAWASRLGRCTPRTTSLVMPPSLTSALHSGSLSIPNVAVPAPEDDTWYDGTAVSDDDADEARDLRDDSSSADTAALSILCAEIDVAIAALGGVVVPKLGTVTPSDATWVSFTRSLRCESGTDVLTLIGASERAMTAAECDPPPALALRSCIPAVEATGEFRVFVRHNVVVGLSQRDVGVASTFGQAEMDLVVNKVLVQFNRVVCDLCTDFSVGEHEGYIYDIYVDRQWRVWILDFAPWGPPTDGLLFNWEELQAADWMQGGCDNEPEVDGRPTGEERRRPRPQLRCVGSSSALRPAQTIYDAMPVELRGLDAGDALAAAAKRLMELGERKPDEVDSGGNQSD